MKKILVTYNSNNSGGSWWLEDKDWKNLVKAGWKISNGFLGSIATTASKKFNTITEALQEFEKITGQDVSDEGCNCCGAPHSFEWANEIASGEDLLQYLYPDKIIPRSLREALEN